MGVKYLFAFYYAAHMYPEAPSNRHCPADCVIRKVKVYTKTLLILPVSQCSSVNRFDCNPVVKNSICFIKLENETALQSQMFCSCIEKVDILRCTHWRFCSQTTVEQQFVWNFCHILF